MRRSALKRYLQELIRDVERRSYDHWIAQDFPVTYEDAYEGEPVQVEIDLLESTPEYVHLIVAVSNGWLSQYLPVSTSTIIRKNGGLG